MADCLKTADTQTVGARLTDPHVCAPNFHYQRPQEGGGWLKHSGHQHWRDELPTCIPLTKEEAEAQLETVTC